MRYQSMHNPYFARRAWNTFQAKRPLNHKGPNSQKSNTNDEGEKIKDELAAVFIGDKPPPFESQGDTAMIKLNCGINRKIGQPNYGSRGAAVNVEMELESSAAEDAELLHERIKKLFSMARMAVDEELGLTNSSNGANRPATEAQLRAVKAICERLGLEAEQEVQTRCDCNPSELSLSDASKLIDQLKDLTNGQQ